MTQSWASEEYERHPRFPYNGTVRLMVPFSPWRLLLNLDGENLSASGLKAVLKKLPTTKPKSTRPAPSQGPTRNNLKPQLKGSQKPHTGRQAAFDFHDVQESSVESLIVEGDPYELQLDHHADHLPAPVLPARLVRREKTSTGLLLAFVFDEANTDLLSLVHELAQEQADSDDN